MCLARVWHTAFCISQHSTFNNLKHTQMTNKKTYNVPEMDIVRIAQASMIATSIPVDGGDDVDGADKANAFEGGITEEE